MEELHHHGHMEHKWSQTGPKNKNRLGSFQEGAIQARSKYSAIRFSGTMTRVSLGNKTSPPPLPPPFPILLPLTGHGPEPQSLCYQVQRELQQNAWTPAYERAAGHLHSSWDPLPDGRCFEFLVNLHQIQVDNFLSAGVVVPSEKETATGGSWRGSGRSILWLHRASTSRSIVQIQMRFWRSVDHH